MSGTGFPPKRSHTHRKIAAIFAGVLFFISTAFLYSQTQNNNDFTVRASAETVVPLFGDSEIFNFGFGGSISAEYFILPFLGPSLFAGMDIMPVQGLESLTLLRGGAGAGFRARPADRFTLRADLYGGIYTTRWMEDSFSGLLWGVRGEAGIRVTPALTPIFPVFYSYYDDNSFGAVEV